MYIIKPTPFQLNKKMSSINHTFVQQIQNLVEWIDTEAVHMDKEAILDGVRVRVLVMAQKFVAFPHCHNFSLMAPRP